MSSRNPPDRTTFEFTNLRMPDEELIVNSMATLIEKLLHSMAEKMRFCVFMMDHGYEMSIDQTFELAHVLAEYTDKVCTENLSTFLRKLEAIEDETRNLESSTSHGCNAPTNNKHVAGPNLHQIKYTISLQPQAAPLPVPEHRSTILTDTPLPMEDGMVDTLWDFVRKHGFEVLRQDEVGHLLELLKYYTRVMTRGDGPTPYRIGMPI